MPTITRKIELLLDLPNDKDEKEFKSHWETLHRWNQITREAANLISTHKFIQEQAKNMLYLSDGAKRKLADITKDDEGILNGSSQNSTYKILSDKFVKPKLIPSDIMTCLNQAISRTFTNEKQDVFYGKKSLRTYRNIVPIPFSISQASYFEKRKEKSKKNSRSYQNYYFKIHGIPFKTKLGRDRSWNEILLDRAIKGEYKLCNSSLQVIKKSGKWKIYLLAVLKFDKEPFVSDKDKEAVCRLDKDYAIVIKDGKKKGEDWVIGNVMEYLYKRKAIIAARERIQKHKKYNSGGRGRAKKLKTIKRLEKREIKFVENRMHTYSRELIRYCVRNKIGKIILENYEEREDEYNENVAAEEQHTFIDSWSYYNLAGKITYKAAMLGIEVVKPKKATKKKKKKEKILLAQD